MPEILKTGKDYGAAGSLGLMHTAECPLCLGIVKGREIFFCPACNMLFERKHVKKRAGARP